MNEEQFDAIVAQYFPRISEKVALACKDNLLHGLTAYAAEKKHGLGKATAGRYSAKIQAQYDFMCEVMNNV